MRIDRIELLAEILRKRNIHLIKAHHRRVEKILLKKFYSGKHGSEITTIEFLHKQTKKLQKIHFFFEISSYILISKLITSIHRHYFG